MNEGDAILTGIVIGVVICMVITSMTVEVFTINTLDNICKEMAGNQDARYYDVKGAQFACIEKEPDVVGSSIDGKCKTTTTKVC